MNRTIKAILEESFGATVRERTNPFADLCGTLPSDEAAALLEAERDSERIDAEDWS